ncbi:MAG: hypothetical protein K8I27_04180 [Planctomycetes bacterium]|nr:hypothetical protein [Planctomycetota bacterium]
MTTDLEHAMAMLRAASIQPDPDRRERVYKAAQGARSIHYLWPLAAGVAACFIFGLGVLIFLAIGGGTHQPLIATANIPQAVNSAPDAGGGTLDNTESTGGSTQTGSRPKARPAWVTKQIADVGAPPIGLGGGSPPAGGGDSSGGSGSGFGGVTGGGNDPLTKVAKLAGFTVFSPANLAKYTLQHATIERADKTGAEFDILRIDYRLKDKKLLILQAANTNDARNALSAEGLDGTAFSVVRDGTVVLLVSNDLTIEQLRELELKPVK